MKSRQYLICFAAALGVILADTASTQAYQQNQTCGEAGPRPCEADETPTPIAWDHACVIWHLDERGSDDFEPGADGVRGSRLESVVKRSFDTWNDPSCSGLRLIYGGTRQPDDEEVEAALLNMVVFERDDWPSGSAMTFATTVVNFDPNDGRIRTADIIVNDQFYTFSLADSPEPGEADLQNTITHEVGHLLGLAHTREPQAAMYGSAPLGETRKRTLHRDDIDGLCEQYPTTEYSSSCGSDDDSLTPDDDLDRTRWGEDDDGAGDQAGCNVTSTHRLVILEYVVIIVGLLGGLWCWRRTRRYSGG
jgi:hypothetical protein